jgi:stage V sporulation protein AF
LGLANKISKLLFILAVIAFNWYGFAILVILWIIYLARMKSFGKPYLYPLIPFDGKMMIKVLFRMPLSKKGMKAKE